MQHVHRARTAVSGHVLPVGLSSLPKQARDFAEALKTKFVTVELVYVPGESHISEISDVIKHDD